MRDVGSTSWWYDLREMLVALAGGVTYERCW